MKTFLDQGSYSNEQLSNVTALMDDICRAESDTNYTVSTHIDINKFHNNHTEGKANRCQAIDDSLDSMYYVFKRAALNRSEPLDFSMIKFYPNATDRNSSYGLVDLINTSWIQSDTLLEHVCNITDSVKRYVQERAAAVTNSTSSSSSPSPAAAAASSSSAGVGSISGSSSTIADKRAEHQPRRVVVVFNTVFDMIDRVLDPILGLQKRLMWETTNSLQMTQNRISSGLGSIRDGFGYTIKSTRGRLSNIFSSSSSSNSTSAKKVNGTQSSFNVTTLTGPKSNMTVFNVNATSVTPNPKAVTSPMPVSSTTPAPAGKVTSTSASSVANNKLTSASPLSTNNVL